MSRFTIVTALLLTASAAQAADAPPAASPPVADTQPATPAPSAAPAPPGDSSPSAVPPLLAASPAVKAAPVPADETLGFKPVPAGTPDNPTRLTKGLSVAGLPGQGFTVSTNDGRYSLNTRLRFQLRDTAAEQAPTSKPAWTNLVNVKTLRLVFSGHLLSPDIGYFVQLALAQGDYDAAIASTSPLYDAFVEFTQLRDLSLRVGQFFVPFDRARTIREYALQFVDRQQMVNELNLDRDVGIRLYSENLFGLNGLLGYSLGVFTGKGKDRLPAATQPELSVPGYLAVARLQIKPFGLFDDDVESDPTREMRPRLAVGGAVAYNHNTDRTQSTFGTVLTSSTLDYFHADADLVFKYGGFSFLGEYLYRQGDVNYIQVTAANKATGAKAVDQYARDARGYTVQAGYLFPFNFEVTGRFDQLFAVGNTDPTLITLANTNGREAGFGLDYYFNSHQMKVQGDYFRYWGPVESTIHNQIRIQLDITI